MIFHGVPNSRFETIQDASNPATRLPFLLLLASLLIFGFFPKLLTDKIRPTAQAIVTLAADKVESSAVSSASQGIQVLLDTSPALATAPTR